MPITDQKIRDILMRIDLVELVNSYVSLKKRGANYLGLCPFHNEKTPSFTVSPLQQLYYCFGCHQGGNAFTFLTKHKGLSFQEAVAELGQQVGLPIANDEKIVGALDKNALKNSNTLMSRATKFYQAELSNHLHVQKYLENRGINQESWQNFDIK